jgi:tellurite resistance protein TerC
VEPRHQHKVLFWGILGALVMRAIFIFAGVAVVRMFHWTFYVFGVFLIYTGIQMVLGKDKKAHPEKSWLLRAARKILPVTPDFVGDRFFARHEGKLYVTPMFIVLLVVESSDVVFAVDSIPAILGVTTDPFLVYSSNVFAILGLRAFYFAIAGIMPLFKHLHYGLSLILAFIGVKMLIADFYPIPVGWALAVVAAILAVSMVTSSVSKR